MVDIELLAKEGKLFDGRYKLIRTLSTDGGTADVWLAIDINTVDNPDFIGGDTNGVSAEETGMMVAIKIYRPKNALDIEGEQRFRGEYKVVHNCRHTNLLQPTNFSICDETPYLELPYCKNGSSEKLIGRNMDEKDIWKFIFDVSSGLSYLHACIPQIVHQDIKPANVLIDDYNNYAITDFGISSQGGDKHVSYFDEDNSGTMAYMAPERFKENYKPVAESDIWAFGATLYEILTGSVPFGEEGGRSQLEKNMKVGAMGGKIPKDVQRLVFSCLSLNPKERPTANQIIKISEKHINSSSGILKYTSLVVLLLLASWGIYKFLTTQSSSFQQPISRVQQDTVTRQVTVSIEDIYEDALGRLNSKDVVEAKRGLNIMDSLSEKKYIPAMFHLAKIYGWAYNDNLLKQKDILGIEYYKDKKPNGLPLSKEYNEKALSLLHEILASKEIEENEIYIIKSNAAYIICFYYVYENEIFDINRDSLGKYMTESKFYLSKVKGEDDLKDKRKRQFENLEKELEKKIKNN